MIKVGVIGLGMMGLTHLDVYTKNPGVKVVAISDKDPDRLSGKTRATGNVKGQAQGGFSYDSVKKYDEGMDLINDPEIDLVDICLITPLHVEYGIAALKAGKHLLIEKPLSNSGKNADKLVEFARKSKKIAMPAQCMRFWPGWSDLKTIIDEKRYGKVLSAHFRRVASHPGGPFYSNGELCGGAALDLHIHDTDFIQFLFGVPKAVMSRGYSKITKAVDHLSTQYIYDKVPLVVAEGGWAMAKGYGFNMQYTINFEKATMVFDLAKEQPLTLIEEGKDPAPVKLPAAMGYQLEIEYILECIKNNTKPKVVTLKDAANSVKIVEAEVKSVKNGGKAVSVKV